MIAAQRPMRDFALEVHFSRWEFAARHNLAASDCESMSVRELTGLAGPEARTALDEVWLGYTETHGAPALRERIAGTYERVNAGEVVCFAGAEEAIYIVMRVLLEPGDHAVTITPNYQAAETVPLSVCEVSGVPLDPARDWELDIDRLRACLRPNTKLVSINFPNNPTGKILPRASFDALVALCRERGLWLFSDEVYRLIERRPEQRLPQAVDAYERGISLNVLSKAYGLPGLRIGWLACRDRKLLQRCERYKHFLSICNSAPSEMLAHLALGVGERILDRNRTIVRDNLQTVSAFFAAHRDRFEWREPDGGCVGFVRYLGADGVEAFTQRLVEEAGVLLLPSSVYRSELGPVPADHFRIGFGRKGVPQALGALGDWLDREDR